MQTAENENKRISSRQGFFLKAGLDGWMDGEVISKSGCETLLLLSIARPLVITIIINNIIIAGQQVLSKCMSPRSCGFELHFAVLPLDVANLIVVRRKT